MTEIRFRNFEPKDEDLKKFYIGGVSMAGMYRSLEKEFREAVEAAKNFQVSKTPLSPNWDLKRTFNARNKKLTQATSRAIARLNGATDVEMEDETSGPVIPESAERLSFVRHHQDALSDDEDDYYRETMRTMAGISKGDLEKDEE
jgi:hypothetical protein